MLVVEGFLSRRILAGLLLALAGSPMLLAGCGRKAEDKTGSHVLANVDGEEIVARQLDYILSRQASLTNAPEDIRRQVLDKLIDRQLAYREALKLELDRQPDVQMALEETKREIIAGAYLRKIVAAQPKPGEAEAARYFNEHPYLFTRRKIFRLRELVVPIAVPQVAEVKAAVAQGRPLEAIAGRLQAQGVRFSANMAVRPAEQLPMGALADLAAAAPGRMVSYETSKALLVYQVIESQDSPVDQAAATAKILEHLAMDRANKAIEAEVKRLRAAGKVEYMGDLPGAAASGQPAALVPPLAADKGGLK